MKKDVTENERSGISGSATCSSLVTRGFLSFVFKVLDK